jgi:nucleoid-associated protein YgaU
MQRDLRRPFGSAFVLLAASTATFAALVIARPRLAPGPAVQSGDDLALAAVWILAVACAAWLTLTSWACLVALVRGRPGVAARIAGFGPPLARRIVEAALAGTFAVLPATTLATPLKPLVVRVGPGGRLTGAPGASPHADAPVVRTPPPTSAPAAPSTRPEPIATPTTTSTPSAAPPAPAAPVLRRAAAPRTYVVQPGDNLWRIARAETVRATGDARPDNRTVADYWDRVIATNRTTLRSGDPSRIFPGEVVALPSF